MWADLNKCWSARHDDYFDNADDRSKTLLLLGMNFPTLPNPPPSRVARDTAVKRMLRSVNKIRMEMNLTRLNHSHQRSPPGGEEQAREHLRDAQRALRDISAED